MTMTDWTALPAEALEEKIAEAAQELMSACLSEAVMLATAESCTGGLVAGALTDIPGSSSVLERGWVTYSNAAKSEEIGVDAALIAAEGAVSPNVAEAMARGAAKKAGVHLGIGVTGVAGPGASESKPVGLVYFGAAVGDRGVQLERRFGDRLRWEIRRLSVLTALELAREELLRR